jgi:hypothetical protein
MILVRDVFQLQFGKARDAIEVWKEGLRIGAKVGIPQARLLTDFAGPDYYTLVLELTFASLSEYEQMQQKLLGSEEWKKWYQRFLPLVKGGHREILRIVE